MPKKKTNITITRQLDLEYPERETGYVIARSDWTRLKKRIERITSSGATFMSLGCLFVGIGVTALFVAIMLTDVGDVKHTVCWVVSIATIVAGGLLIFFHFTHQHGREQFSKDEVKSCLDEIEGKFPKHTESEF